MKRLGHFLECCDHVALIRRKHAPGKGLLALPGGFVNNNETVRAASIREAQEETRIGLPISQLRHALVASEVFDYPQRSARGRVITHAFHYKLELDHCPEIAGSDDAAWAGWVPKSELVAMEDQFHDDHFHILDHFFQLT